MGYWGGGGAAIGGPVGSGTSGSVLYIDSSGNLAQRNPGFTYDGSTLSVLGTGTSSERFGASAIASGLQSTSLGNAASAAGDYSTAVGYNASAGGALNASAFGAYSNASGTLSIAFGRSALSSGQESSAIGQASTASALDAFAAGYSASATAVNSTAIGSYAAASVGTGATAIGRSSVASAASTAIGYLAQATAASTTAVGISANASSSLCLAVGHNALAGSGGADANNTAVGANATAALASTAVGRAALANGDQSLAFGNAASATGIAAFAFGTSASASGNGSIAIGQTASSGFTGSIALGRLVATTAANQFVMGTPASSGFQITNVFFGSGVTATAPLAYTINGSGASGANIAGADLQLAGGKATGSAAGGSILFQTSDALGSGSTLQSLTTKASLSPTGVFTATTFSGSGTSLTGVALLGSANAFTAGPQSFTIGGVDHVALGTSASVSGVAGVECIAIGLSATANFGGTAVGRGAIATGTSGAACAFGYGSIATGPNSFAMGFQATSTNSGSMALGIAALATGNYAIGINNQTGASSGNATIAMGYGCSATHSQTAVFGQSGLSRAGGNFVWCSDSVDPSFLFQRQSSTGTERDLAGLATTWVVATDASRTARMVFNAYDTAARECVRMEASGSAAMIGFLGASAIVRPVNTVAIDTLLVNLGLRASGGSTPLDTKISSYNAIATAGWGVPAIYGSGRSTAQTTGVSSVASYTVGASDGSFLISANVNVTASAGFTMAVQVDYTDETNTARTLTLNFSQLTGTLINSITNVTGAGPYEGIPNHIRCKASTSITIKTTGAFASVTYNVEGTIYQIA